MRTIGHILSLHVAALATTLAPARATDLLVVDSTGTTPYVTVQAAVDAASDGDVIVVLDPPWRSTWILTPSHAGFEVAGKSLTIVARQVGETTFDAIRVRDLAPGQSVQLLGMRATRADLSNNLGAVSFGSCRIAHGATVTSSVDVRLVECRLAGPPALRVTASTVTLDACEVLGDEGYWGPPSWTYCMPGGPGFPALVATGAHVRARGTTLIGGPGGQGSWPYSCPGTGAPAVSANGTSTVLLQQCTIHNSGPATGAQGTIVPGPALQLDASWVAPADDRLQVLVEGTPDDTAWLFVSRAAAHAELSPTAGAVLVEPGPWHRIQLGPLVGGVLDTEVILAGASGAEAVVLHMQVVTTGPSGVRFGAARQLLVLGPDAPFAPPRAAVHVDASAMASGSGRSWSEASADLSQALRYNLGSLEEPSEVWIREGTHLVGSDGFDRNRPATLPIGAVVRGGFRGDEVHPDQRTPSGHETILTGDALGDDGPGFINRSDNARRMFVQAASDDQIVGPALVLDRLTLRGVERSGSGFISIVLGTSFWSRLSEIRFEDNRVEHCIYDWGFVEIERCTFMANDAYEVVLLGGGLDARSSLWYGNRGAAIVGGNNNVWIRNCTVTGNVVPAGEAAVRAGHVNSWWGVGGMSNTIIWNNSAGGLRNEAAQFQPRTVLTLVSCCIGGWTGTLGSPDNHGLDPLFVDPVGPDGIPGTRDDDYRLRAGSPCVDSGDNGALPSGFLLDLDGRPRVVDDPATPNPGGATGAVVDRGAYER
jgi:hypothetical protein